MLAVVKEVTEFKSYEWNLAAYDMQEVTPD